MSIKKVLLAAVVLAVVVLALFSTPSLIINLPYKNNPFSGGVIGKTSPFEELVSKLIEKGQLRSGLSHPVERNGYEWQVWIDSVAAEGSSVAGTAAEGQTHNYGWNNIAAQASSDELEKIFEDFVSKLEIKKSSDFNDEVWMIYNNDPGGEKVVTRRRSCVVRVFIRPKKEKDNMIKSDPAESEMDGPADHRNKSPRRGPGLNK